MELTTLKYFATVARELHFRRAAAKLNITQAPLSAAIKKLEDELEIQLFERTSRSVKLTHAGKIFLPEAEAVLHRAALARKRLDELINGESGKLAIAYNETAFNTVLVQLLAAIRTRFPKLHLELRELETLEQLNALEEEVIDIGFNRPYGFDLKGLSSQLIHREDYCLVMLEDHPLAQVTEIGINELSNQNIILFARDVNPEIYDTITGLLSNTSCPKPIFRQDARNKSSMLALAKAGFGAALLPESSFSDPGAGLISRKLAIKLPPVDIQAVWNPAKISPVLELVIAALPQLDVIS